MLYHETLRCGEWNNLVPPPFEELRLSDVLFHIKTHFEVIKENNSMRNNSIPQEFKTVYFSLSLIKVKMKKRDLFGTRIVKRFW
jgi:hypothetical protein